MSKSLIAPTRPNKTKSIQPRKKLILCIDDDWFITSSLAMFLKAKNYRVQSATTRGQGWRKSINLKPDAIVTDLAMPDGSGEDLVADIMVNQKTQDIPVFVLTGMSDLGIENRMNMLGVKKVFRKPFSSKQIVTEIQNCLDDIDYLVEKEQESTVDRRDSFPGQQHFLDASHQTKKRGPYFLSCG